jgi:hypothetical protein
MIIVDEFHHSAAKIYEIVNTFPAIYRIVLTATDMRNDGLEKVLNFYFGDECYRYLETENDEDIIAPKDVKIITKNSTLYYNPPDVYVYPNSKKEVSFVSWSDEEGVHHLPWKNLDEDMKYHLLKMGLVIST